MSNLVAGIEIEIMAEDGKLININLDTKGLSGLSDGVKSFADMISREVGAFTKPIHTKRMAKANAESAIIAAEGQIKLTDVQQRGLRRVAITEGRRQINIESIAQKAIPHISDNAKAEKVDHDWLDNFFDKSRHTSNPELQQIWAKLLAGEVNRPTSVSKRTINLVAQLDSKDAKLFTEFCSYVWVIFLPTLLIFDISDGMLGSNGVSFESLKHLDVLGLLSFESLSGYQRNNLAKQFTISYYGRYLVMELPAEKNALAIGHALLSETGTQLINICSPTPSEGHYLSVVKRFMDQGYIMNSLVGNKSF